MTWDTLLIDSTDVRLDGVRLLQVWENAHDTPSQRGDLPTYPGRDGQGNVDQPFGPTVLSLGLMVRGSTVTGFNDAYRTLRTLCKPGRTVHLERRLSYAGGNESQIATGKMRSITPSQLTPADYKVVVEFAILDGLWYSTNTVTMPAITTPDTIFAAGEVRTHRISIDLTGGTNPTLTNGTNGHALTYTGSTATTVTVDVEAMTATQGGTDVSANLSWKRTMPFRIEPGSQLLVCNSGSATITYTPAYL